MDKASEALYALKPVSFRYNKEYDATQTLAYGLIAEEVAEVVPRSGGTQSRGRARIGPLRAGQRDVAQRVPQRASQDQGNRKRLLRSYRQAVNPTPAASRKSKLKRLLRAFKK